MQLHVTLSGNISTSDTIYAFDLPEVDEFGWKAGEWAPMQVLHKTAKRNPR
jgi:hypothetical protein